MSVDTVELEKWFKERPQWLQDAARRLFQAGIVKVDDLKELLVLCKSEAGIAVEGNDKLKPLPIPAALFNLRDAAIALKLDSISEVKGINALAPRKGLEFGNNPMVIVFGATGSGKSGYTRLLKHACGGKGLGILYGNVFAAAQPAQSCKFSYSLGTTKHDLPWTPAIGVHADLRTIALYDTDCAHVYVNNENELTYEPPLLSYFRILVEVCEDVGANPSAGRGKTARQHHGPFIQEVIAGRSAGDRCVQREVQDGVKGARRVSDQSCY
jgi:hypothetical protein